LIVSLVICFGASAIGSAATISQIDGWYATLEKPSFNPPNWIFGPVWSLLFFLMAISVWLVWRRWGWKAAQLALVVFLVQLGANVLWSILFFGMQRPDLAFFEICLLWLLIVFTIGLFFRKSKLAGGLMIPYLAWVSFAAVLNFMIWRLNIGSL
jgi:tryptophan-rich sensory protein